MKRGKIASKLAIKNILFHHYHHHHHRDTFPSRDGVFEPSHLQSSPTDYSQESDVSCTNTPLNPNHNLANNKKGGQYQHHRNNSFYYTPLRTFDGTDSFEAIYKVLEAVSPLPSKEKRGVRQLRITDSPFPLQSEEGYDRRVDQAAEDFIKRFYSRIEKQVYD
ncbi:uncharacterized protein LOC110715465 [Chenopodium quinoa]|uniref:uncharacterized protein LOC110715465 n=1 Tax=Chenopodium quinoa TaxID=63459 RepID=UPI000B78619E|nr:uncharacterized protein LOC110715465 [Chenopodium quinoa]